MRARTVGEDRLPDMHAKAPAGLDLEAREVLTVMLLVGPGGSDPRVHGHVAGNLRVGNAGDVLLGRPSQLVPCRLSGRATGPPTTMFDIFHRSQWNSSKVVAQSSAPPGRLCAYLAATPGALSSPPTARKGPSKRLGPFVMHGREWPAVTRPTASVPAGGRRKPTVGHSGRARREGAPRRGDLRDSVGHTCPVPDGRAPVRLAVVNDFDLVVHGVRMMLAPWSSQIQIVELDVRSKVARRVDIALLDTFAQDRTVAQRARLYLNQGGVHRVAVYSWSFTSESAQALLEIGVAGVISKRLPAANLAGALLDIAQGQTVVAGFGRDERSSGHPSPIAAPTPAADWPGREYGLTQREAEIIALITQGITNEEITTRTFLSHNTVKTYIRSAYRKIGVSSRSQAVAWGLRHQLVPHKTSTFPDSPASFADRL